MVMKRRAQIQAEYGKQNTVGVIHNANYEDPDLPDKVTSYDVKVMGEDKVLRKIDNATSIKWEAGNAVTLTRLNRVEWQIIGQAYMKVSVDDMMETKSYLQLDSGNMLDSGYVLR